MDIDVVVRQCLRLDPDSPSGLRWAQDLGRRVKAGQPAFTAVNSHGYYLGSVRGHQMKAHRAVFFLAHGYWPAQVDHIDGNRANNQPENLREVTAAENQHNRVSRGYTYRYGKYQAKIRLNKRVHILGTYSSAAEARAAYLAAKAELHPTAPTRCYEETPCV